MVEEFQDVPINAFDIFISVLLLEVKDYLTKDRRNKQNQHFLLARNFQHQNILEHLVELIDEEKQVVEHFG